MRIRTRQGRPHTGSRTGKAYGTSQPWYTTIVNVFDTEYCEDTVHPHPYVAEGNLYLRKVLDKPSRVTGRTKYYDYYGKTQRNACFALHNFPVTGNHDGVETTVHWDRLEVGALSRVQDTQPIVDLPLAIGELKDFPRLIKSVAEKGARLAASPEGFLTWQWAISPMLNDLVAAVSLQKQIAQRVKSHRRKYRTERASGKLPREVYLTDPGYSSFSVPLAGSQSAQGWYSTKLEKVECWFTARLTPLIELDELLGQVASYSHSTGFGRNGMVAAYNLMPWSWLIDYFSTLGSLIELRHNQMPYKVESVSLMARSEVLRTCEELTFTAYSQDLTPKSTMGECRIVEKRRKIVHDPIGRLVVDPILSKNQLLNLAALASVFGKHAARLR